MRNAKPSWIALVLLGVAGDARGDDLTSLSIEQLLDTEVTIVSKVEERFAAAAAALTVISSDDIRRTGARSFPEALRLAPGLHVGRATSSIWGVSARGFSSVNSGKLLVLIDGRSVYTPLFSGVFWDVQQTLMADVDKIEVVRGPGATLWGANAVNGVVNILSKHAKDTQGGLIELGAGSEHRNFAAARWGGRAGDDVYFRVHGKLFSDDGGWDDGADDWQMANVGFRVDAALGQHDELVVTGEGYAGEVGQVRPSVSLSNRPPPTGELRADLGGASLNAAWTRRFAAASDLKVRLTYDRTQRDDPTYRDHLDIFDLGVKGSFALPAQELVVGANYRLMNDQLLGKGIIELRPPRAVDHLVSAFAQDTLSLLAGALRITVGAKIEHNDYSGLELQPGLRTAWDPARGHTLWGAASRATRVPTRIERDIFGDASAPGDDPAVHLLGNPELEGENLLALELGYRGRLTPNLLVDLAAFYFRYDDLVTFELGTPFPEGGGNILPVRSENAMHGRSLGAELAVTFTPTKHWRLVGNYSFIDVELTPDGMDPTMAERIEDATPDHQLSLRSALDLPHNVTFDLFARWIAGAETSDPADPLEAYVDLDVRLAWRPVSAIELAVVAQSLLERHHREIASGTDVERSFYAMVTAWF